MKFSFSLILLLSFLASCTTSQEQALETTLSFAGANRAELEKVLHHYQHYSFDDFCRYLLPYWIGDEAPDNWRRTFAARYRPVLDSLYQGTDVVVAVDSLQHYLQRTILVLTIK